MTALPDPAALARLHARCFTAPRPWDATEFAALMAMPGVFLLRPAGGADAFLMGRALAGEAELLTLAVAPEARRAGIARRLGTAFARRAHTAGATQAFLEVAEENAAARALYAQLGWLEAGRRRGYYGPGADAIVMRLSLGAGQEGS